VSVVPSKSERHCVLLPLDTLTVPAVVDEDDDAHAADSRAVDAAHATNAATDRVMA
jgi:hypothetical protein